LTDDSKPTPSIVLQAPTLAKLASLSLLPLSPVDAVTATYYYGFDRSTYPGDAVMQDWWNNTPMFFTGFYLAPAPHHSNTSWMTKRSTIFHMGWGFAPLYVGRQVGDANLNAAQGRTDAHNAAALSTTAGFPNLSYLFLDIETGGTLSSAFISYIVAWCSELAIATNYHPGVYCSYTSASQINNALGGLVAKFWCWRLGCPPSPGCHQTLPAPAPSNASQLARVWQYAQSGIPGNCTGFQSNGRCDLSSGGTGYPVDLDTATSTDPSYS
jgi:Rv2525c-like, glycoside hydrolase-like domain